MNTIMSSPFTTKYASVCPTIDIIRQGRSSLVNNLQMFKIVGLNCLLVTAYVMSGMYFDGVNIEELGVNFSGVFASAFFFSILDAQPLPTLSAQRPHPNIFCFYFFLSMLGQFALHIIFLISSVKEANKQMQDVFIKPEDSPNSRGIIWWILFPT